jgi:ribose/xylose/arabinose/galactoside ABC-type transport system permease subunit
MTAISSSWRTHFALRNAGVVYAFLIVVAAFTIINATSGRRFYLDGRNVANVLEQTSLVGVLAVFMTIVLVSGNFDLSVGAGAAITAGAAVAVLDQLGIAGAITVALACGLVIGLINGLLVQVVGVNSFIVTLGTLTILRGLFLAFAGGRSVTADDNEAIEEFRQVVISRWSVDNVLVWCGVVAVSFGAASTIRRRRRTDGSTRLSLAVTGLGLALCVLGVVSQDNVELAASAWYFLIIATAVWLAISRTVIGRRLYAVGGNAEAARLAGISVNRYRIGAFVVNGLAAAFAGVMFAARTGTVTPIALTNVELTVIAACILGGVSLFGGSGSVLKSVVGALILFTLANGFNILNIGAYSQKLIEGAIIIAAAAIYTIGGRRHADDARRQSHVKIGAPPDADQNLSFDLVEQPTLKPTVGTGSGGQ